MKLEDLKLTIDEQGVATVTLNRPDIKNAFTPKIREEIGKVFESLGDDDRVRAVVLTGAGKDFCAGGNLQAMEKEISDNMKPLVKRDSMIRNPIRAIEAITNIEKPVIAMIRGYAIGAGLGITTACDLRYASVNAKFGMIFAKVGVALDWGSSYFIPRLIGLSKAKELMFTERMFAAAEAENMGLINRAVPDNELETVVYDLAHKLASGPTRSYGLIKTQLKYGMENDLRSAQNLEALIIATVSHTDDHIEGVKAFLEKRPPVFNGR